MKKLIALLCLALASVVHAEKPDAVSLMVNPDTFVMLQIGGTTPTVISNLVITGTGTIGDYNIPVNSTCFPASGTTNSHIYWQGTNGNGDTVLVYFDTVQGWSIGEPYPVYPCFLSGYSGALPPPGNYVHNGALGNVFGTAIVTANVYTNSPANVASLFCNANGIYMANNPNGYQTETDIQNSTNTTWIVITNFIHGNYYPISNPSNYFSATNSGLTISNATWQGTRVGSNFLDTAVVYNDWTRGIDMTRRMLTNDADTVGAEYSLDWNRGYWYYGNVPIFDLADERIYNYSGTVAIDWSLQYPFAHQSLVGNWGTSNGDFHVAGYTPIQAKYVYWGDETVDGSWRMGLNSATSMVIQVRVSGSWVNAAQDSAGLSQFNNPP